MHALRLGLYFGLGLAMALGVFCAVLFGCGEVADAARASTGAGLGIPAGPCPGGSAGRCLYQAQWCEGIPSNVRNGPAYTASSFVGGYSEGCGIVDASYAPGDCFLHQGTQYNDAAGAPCTADWSTNGAGLWVPPDVGGPWQPTTNNPTNIGMVQSRVTFGGGAPWVFEFSIRNPDLSNADSNAILFSSSLFCPPGSLSLWGCEWAKGFYTTNPPPPPDWWEIDLNLGTLNLYFDNASEIGTSYALPSSCHPLASACTVDAVITPGVSIAVWVNGVHAITGSSARVPTEAMFFQFGTFVVHPGPGTYVGVQDQLVGTVNACAYAGVPHC